MSTPQTHLESGLEGKIADKVARILEVLGVSELGKASKADVVIALGRLLSFNIERGSVHEVTKEVRRAIELVVFSPLNKEIELAVYTNPPFDHTVLNTVYRRLLSRLLEIVAAEASELAPLWKRRLVNLIAENIYNVASDPESVKYRKEIANILRDG